MLAEVAGQRLGGDTHPAISPDGSMLAFCTGQHTLNSLAVIPMDKLEATPEILVQGSSFGVQAFCAQPTWSPDGSELAFVYTTLVTSLRGTEIQSNLYTVSTDGGDPIQISSFSGNEIVSRPSFSPDGTSLAFSLLKSSGEVFLLSDIINFTYTSDIYAISTKKSTVAKGKSAPVALTSDGKSIDPSWGLVKNTVGLPEWQESGSLFALYQNYPNPFNSTTHLDYRLEEPTHVRIEVYDMLGRLVCVLADQRKAEGRHQLSWSGQDMFGRLVPEGMYVCTMKVPGLSFSRRMVLQR
jgi:hypothetical protein